MIWMISSLSLGAEVNFEPKIEIPLVLVATGGYFYLKNQEPRDTTTMANPGAIDRWGAPRWNGRAIPFSDFMGHPFTLYGLNLPVLSTLALGVGVGLKNGVRQGVAHSMIVTEAIAFSAVVTQGLKGWISRPRPFTSLEFQRRYPDVYNDAYIQEEIREKDAWMSMPSGHTTAAAATYTSVATLLSLQYPKQRYWFYSSAAVLIVIAGGARVVAGMHHITDVLVGALLGAGIGYGVAKLHEIRPSEETTASPGMFVFQGTW